MELVTLDFETFYDDKYSITKMTTEEYINDPRFQIIMVGVKVGKSPTVYVSFPTQDQYATYLGFLRSCAVLSHNAKFDAAILSWKLGIKPKFLFDTLSMSRALYGTTVRHRLDDLAVRLDLSARKGHEVHSAAGKRLHEFTPDELAAYGGYCTNDVELCREAFDVMRPSFPTVELHRIDLTLRMFTDPVIVLDKEKILREIEIEQQKKAQLLKKVSDFVEAGDLTSNDKFAAVLRQLGVEPPTKVSTKKSQKAGREIRTWAFAKGDADFKALLKHPNELVVALVEARLGHKSTQKETRAARFLGIAERMGVLPVPLGYYKAHTGRYGGEDNINLQNLPGVKGKDGPDVALLRKSMRAPDGYVFGVPDLSQIEARLLVWQANQTDKVGAFAAGRDVYSEQASVIYGRHVDRKKVEADYIPGFVGKCTVLGCGYGLGHMKFGGMIYVGMLGGPGLLFDNQFVDALQVNPSEYLYWLKNSEYRDAGTNSKPVGVPLKDWIRHLACAKHIIDVYRRDNQQVVRYWKKAGMAIKAMYVGEEMTFGGPNDDLLRTEKEAIVLPNGLRLRYPNMRFKDGEYTCDRFKEGRVQRVKLYGGAVVENGTQALANIIMGEAMVKTDALGYRVPLQVHDEEMALFRKETATEDLKRVISLMTTPPKWAPGLPLAAEGDIADTYGDAK